MFIFTYAAAILATAFTVTAAAFLFHRRQPLDLALASYLLSAALWIGGNAVADVSYVPSVLILASQLAFLGAILNLFCFLLLVDLIIDRAFPPWQRLFLYGIPCVALAISGFSPYAILDVSFPPGIPAQIVPGAVYSFTLFFDIACLSYGAIRLGIALTQKKNRAYRLQFLYVLVGLLIAISGQMIFDVILPLMGELRFYTLGPIMSVFFAAGCAYAIRREHLLDIRIIAQRGFIYGMLLVGLLGLYICLVIVTGKILSDSTDLSTILSAGITIVVGVFGAPYVEHLFRKVTDRIFFKDTYDYATALHTLSGVLHANAAFADLVRESESALTDILRATSVRITLGSPLEATDIGERSLRIPIGLDGESIGCIYVGEKRSGDAYTAEDIQLLQTFAYQAATALSRAQLYAETKQHATALETKVRERTRELSEAHGRERQMINDISHNLQTPLTVLQTKLDRLKPAMKDDAEVRSFEQSLAGFSGFVYDLLALARLEGGRKPDYIEIDLARMLFELAEEIGIIAAESGVTVTTDIEPAVHVLGDERRLREAFMNIASNALKYMRDDGARTISLSVHTKGDRAELSVIDTGIGIAAGDLPHVFERFYRGKETPKDMKGTGLGLPIAKLIIEQHAGSITAASERGQGTAITIMLPLAPSERERA